MAPPWFELPPPAYGGIEWMCHWLAEGMVERGHDVTLIGAGKSSSSARFISTFEEPPWRRLGQSFPESLHLARAAQVIQTLQPEVVHDHTTAGPLLSFGRSIPTVVTAHGPVRGEPGEYYRALGDRISLVAISEAQRRSAPDLPWAATVYNSIGVGDYPFRKDKQDYVLFLGRMNLEKAPHLAIDAARAAGINIVVAGKLNEPGEHEYFEAEITPRLGPGVEWIGESNTVAKKVLLSNARCLVFPIQWEEPFGLVMVEAMACGTPVIALPGGSVPEVVDDGVTGFICRSPEDLPEAIKKAGDLDAELCRKHALERFDIPHMINGYEDVYQKVAAFVPGPGHD